MPSEKQRSAARKNIKKSRAGSKAEAYDCPSAEVHTYGPG